MRKASKIFMLVAFFVATALYISDSLVTHGYLRMEQASERYIIAQQAASNLEAGSDALTEAVRSFVVTGEIQYLQNYFTEANVTQRRDEAVSNLESMMSRDSAVYEHLSTALSLSNELMYDEYEAMNLVLSNGEYDDSLIPDVLREVALSPETEAKTPAERYEQALNLVYGDRYEDYKARIRSNTNTCTKELIEASNIERMRLNDRMSVLLGVQTVLTASAAVI